MPAELAATPRAAAPLGVESLRADRNHHLVDGAAASIAQLRARSRSAARSPTRKSISSTPSQPGPRGRDRRARTSGATAGPRLHEPARLTAEKFIPDPFSSQPGARLYNTGDLARYRAGRQHRFPGQVRQPGEGPRLPHRAG